MTVITLNCDYLLGPSMFLFLCVLTSCIWITIEVLRTEWEVKEYLSRWGWFLNFCNVELFHKFIACSAIVKFWTRKYYMYFVHVLVIIKRKNSVVSIAIITCCHCAKHNIYSPHLFYDIQLKKLMKHLITTFSVSMI